jgi:RNA polymerase sigma-70 factor (ECF subfamily)
MNVCTTVLEDAILWSGTTFQAAGFEQDDLKDEIPDDFELMSGIAQGDRQAFAQLYDRYSSVLYSTAVRVLNDAREAEDVLQEVFLQIWDRAGQYDSSLGKPFSWAVTLTRNKAIDRLRAARRRFKLVDDAASQVGESQVSQRAPVDDVSSGEQSKIVRSAVVGLPADQRKAIELAFFGGLTQHEISESLGEPLGTIKARIRRGLLKLREGLEGCL